MVLFASSIRTEDHVDKSLCVCVCVRARIQLILFRSYFPIRFGRLHLFLRREVRKQSHVHYNCCVMTIDVERRVEVVWEVVSMTVENEVNFFALPIVCTEHRQRQHWRRQWRWHRKKEEKKRLKNRADVLAPKAIQYSTLEISLYDHKMAKTIKAHSEWHSATMRR